MILALIVVTVGALLAALLWRYRSDLQVLGAYDALQKEAERQIREYEAEADAQRKIADELSKMGRDAVRRDLDRWMRDAAGAPGAPGVVLPDRAPDEAERG